MLSATPAPLANIGRTSCRWRAQVLRSVQDYKGQEPCARPTSNPLPARNIMPKVQSERSRIDHFSLAKLDRLRFRL
jgi:hypothetical protein